MAKKATLSLTSNLQSRTFSPVEKIFHTNVPIMYKATATLKTSFQEPAIKDHMIGNQEKNCKKR